ncbi:MAG: MFS transporter [Gammaproteobacteria bacterium]|nr:MFS transporter [Gammaproteobacteria bacterium]
MHLSTQAEPPVWRISAFYFFYFASVGTLSPYWSLYLDWRGFSGADIGEMAAALAATKIFAPYVWGALADRTGARMGVVRIAAACALLAFSVVLVRTDYLGIFLAMLVYGFFWNANLPQFEANTLTFLRDQPQRYSKLRLWGSVGFIVAVMGIGWWARDASPAFVPYVTLAWLVAIFAASLWVPEAPAQKTHTSSASLRGIVTQPAVLALFAACFLVQLGHGPYYAFYTLYLVAQGYSRELIGALWALGVVAEIGVFLLMPRWYVDWGARRLLLWALGLAVVRWTLIALFPNILAILVFAQLLHAATFGVFHGVVIHIFHHFFYGPHQGRGQALYSSLSFGAGGAVGALYAGYLWDMGGGQIIFGVAAVASAVAWWIAYRGLVIAGNPAHP